MSVIDPDGVKRAVAFAAEEVEEGKNESGSWAVVAIFRGVRCE